MKTADFDRNEVCWSDFKHKQMLKVLDQLDSASREHIEHFASMNSHSAHAAMIPTHQCDMLKIQRFGSTNEIAYASNPSDRHPDGPKWMCPEYLQTSESEQCTIFSIGSNGDFNFEEAMHKFVGNKCKIYTFDCTGNWSNPTTEFHPWCVSDTNDIVDGRQYKTLTTMMKDLDVKKIHLFKVDVEGYEFKMFKSLEKEPLASLPKQILLEVHWGTRWPGQQSFDQDKETWLPYATSFYRGIDKMGYRIALRERNIYNDCCAEYVLVRDI
ncbi:methyltransferase domain-containing protein [Entophlyctis helioformis]|nr:methyltransferase domain-containing protein [Entophlyctis helioformis]